MSQLDDTLKAIIDSHQYMDGDTSYMTQEELDEAKQQIKDLFIELIDNLENHYAYYLNQKIGSKRQKFANELRQIVSEL